MCPYEVARLSLARSKVVVTTYHYLLDPASRWMLIGGDKPLRRVVAVIDEAHNIRDFISGNSTKALSFSDIRQCIADARSLYLPRICAAIAEIGERATEFCSRNPHWLLGKGSFVSALTGSHAKDWLSDLVFELSTNAGVAWYSVATNRNLPSSIIKLGEFLSALLSSISSEQIALVKSDSALFLTDTRPSRRFLEATDGLRSLVLLSATINPSALFLQSIGLDGSSASVHSAVTRNKFRIRTVIDSAVTTRFKMRTPAMYSKIARNIAAICGGTRGGIGVFLPSYSLLEAIRHPLLSEIDQAASLPAKRTNVLVERHGLTNAESEEMMDAFKSNSGSLLLAVQGGRFSEGEDFPGDEMEVSIVVGLPMPPPTPTTYAEYRQMESERFDKHQAYMLLALLPALRKAIQCAGRHVRDPGKVGMVFFMDSRFADQKVIDLMPSWLTDDLVKGKFEAESIRAMTQDFFTHARNH